MPAKKMSRATQRKIEARTHANSSIQHSGFSFDERHYVCIVKPKRGELWNLGHLTEESRVAVTPLFEMFRPKDDFPTHAEEVCRLIAANWGDFPHFIDTRHTGPASGARAADLQILFERTRAHQLQAIPVTATFHSPAYQEAVRHIAQVDGRGAMIRLNIDDFTDPTNVDALLNGLLSVLQLDHSQIDVLLDYGYRAHEADVTQLSGLHLSVLPQLDLWRTITVSSGSFSESISHLGYHTWHSQARSEWLAWGTLRAQRRRHNLRIPTFGDYGIRSAIQGGSAPNTPAPNLRYTSDQIYLIRRGPKYQQQMQVIASDLVSRPEFSGAAFSYGDQQIAAKAIDGSQSDSTPEYWILWCMNHHVEFVTRQLHQIS